jgi:hypothetical protein
MKFNFTDEQVMFKGDGTEICRDSSRKVRFLPSTLGARPEFLRGQCPAEYGVVGSTHLEYIMVIEEFPRVYCSIGGHISVNCLCAGTINDFGTVERKRRYLPSLVKGRCRRQFFVYGTFPRIRSASEKHRHEIGRISHAHRESTSV